VDFGYQIDKTKMSGSAQSRLDAVAGHLGGSSTVVSPGKRKILEKDPNDIVRVQLYRMNLLG